MGVLKDGAYWAGVLNQISVLEPQIGEVISPAHAISIRNMACEAFKKLLADPDFKADLGEVIAAAEAASAVLNAANHPNFQHFVNYFMMIEAKLLRDAGVNANAASALDHELRKALLEPEADRLKSLAEKIAYCQTLACDPSIPEDETKIPLWKVATLSIAGVTTIAVDAGATGAAAFLMGPVGAAVTASVVGISCGTGASIITKAIKRRW